MRLVTYKLLVVYLWLGLIVSSFLAAQEPKLLEHQERIISVSEKAIPAFVFIGGGSGVIISPDGYILTNYHVVGRSRRWEVFRAEGTSYEAELVGYDPEGDIALLKIKDGQNLPYLELGDSDQIKIGQPVIAIGNPFAIGYQDFNPTVTYGVISALHRYRIHYSDAIQTDCPINPGNSGGPLISLDGKIIGINGQIETRFPYILANTGIGYAIPANQIKRFLPHLKKGGRVVHGIFQGLVISLENTQGNGAKVRRVEPGSPAEKMGFQVNDYIIEVEGYHIHSPNRFLGVIGTYPAGETLQVKVKRRNEIVTIKGTLSPRSVRPPIAGTNPQEPYFGALFRQPRDPNQVGVEIESITSNSPAANAGLQPGDIILEFAGEKVEDVKTLRELIKKQETNKEIEIKIIRKGQKKTLSITLIPQSER